MVWGAGSLSLPRTGQIYRFYFLLFVFVFCIKPFGFCRNVDFESIIDSRSIVASFKYGRRKQIFSTVRSKLTVR